MSTNYVVFWLDGLAPRCESTGSLNGALRICEDLRKIAKTGALVSHITMSCENSDQVGQNGVNSIIDGKCPDGHVYDWVKRRAPDKPTQPIAILENCLECQGSGEEFWAGINGLDGDWETCSYCLGTGDKL